MTEQHKNGRTLRLEYNRYGWLSTLYNEKGEPYRFHYSVLGELTREIRLDGTVRALEYSPCGDLVVETLHGTGGGQLQTRFGRDNVGRVVLKEQADHRTEYDHSPGRLSIRQIRQADYRAALAEHRPPDYRVLSFDYDARGQLSAEHNHQGVYQHTYDELGNLTRTVFPDTSELRHFYYGSGHLLQNEFIHNAQHHSLAEYGRDSLHREISRTQGALTERTEYDALGRVTAKLSRAGHRGGIARHYHYNLRNQLQTLGQGEGTFDYGESQTVDYHYDEAGQVLARYRDGEPETWQYDIASNR